MRWIAAVMVAATVVGLGGCATRYQDMGHTGGVVASPLTDDVWRISARGNAFTDETAIQDYILLKAAETTVAAGRTHFLIVGLHDASQRRETRLKNLYAWDSAETSGLQEGLTGKSAVEVKPGSDIMIRLLPLKATAEEKAGALDARQLVANIGPRVKRPEP